MKKSRLFGSLSGKLATLVLAAILLSSSAVAALGYVMQRNDVIANSADRALSVARSVAAGIDSANFEHVMATGEKNSEWYRAKGFVDTVISQNDLAYLYLLDSRYTDTVRYFAEGYQEDLANDGEVEFDLYETEDISVHADEMFETIRTGVATSTDLYNSEGYGTMLSGFAPIVSESGKIIGVVGVDITVDAVLQASNTFRLLVVFIVLGFSVLFGLILTQAIRRMVGRPLNALAEASERLAKGDTELSLDIRSNDEIGNLATAFHNMIESTKRQVEILEALADGDLTVRIDIRGERDALGHALARMVEQLNRMCLDINQTSVQVAEGARQIAAGSDSLAQGSTEQAASVEELSSSIAVMAERTRENASMARRAADLAASIRGGAEKGSEQMEQMLKAVQEISAASRAIQQVIKVINDITFQTNILALNASVEAAHAGAYGAGFAVVADEVRTLAQRSSEAAKNTNDLIVDSMQKADLGARIADATARSFTDIVQNILRSGEIVGEIAGSSEQQTVAIDQINQGIGQVASVVQSNTATAQQSAAASAEMRTQSDTLQELISRFKLDQSARFAPPGAQKQSGSAPSWVWQEDTVALAPDAGYGKY